ncbi:MAG: 50S ribosomal protein L6, partial [Clostridia bacterium]|nr:50S ribosomal protein L6 [Clostridia bacterium]
MSRIGKQPITVPAGVEVTIGANNEITVKGKLGTLSETMSADMIIKKDGDTITVERPSDNKDHRALHGLTRTLIANMVTGVSEGYQKQLEINGVGYRAAKQGKTLV